MPDYKEKNRPEKIREALGESEVFVDFQENLSRAAKVDRPILIIGERGTGKELAAKKMHYLSKRWREPLVALNCAALSPSLIESELFGYEAGAFTGAQKKRMGRFEAADNGTLFLDEIGNIPLEVQSKILRVVEYQSFERVGSSNPIQVDVRIIGATNADLQSMAQKGLFKRDLLDRLSFEVLFVPPLRKRKGDITLLAMHFAQRMWDEMKRPGMPEFKEKALDELENHDWPGNVRELKNVVERAVYRSESNEIVDIVFNPFGNIDTTIENYKKNTIPEDKGPKENNNSTIDLSVSLTKAVADLEIEMIKKALESTRHNQKEAAKILGLTYHQFRGLYRKHEMQDKL